MQKALEVLKTCKLLLLTIVRIIDQVERLLMPPNISATIIEESQYVSMIEEQNSVLKKELEALKMEITVMKKYMDKLAKPNEDVEQIVISMEPINSIW